MKLNGYLLDNLINRAIAGDVTFKDLTEYGVGLVLTRTTAHNKVVDIHDSDVQ